MPFERLETFKQSELGQVSRRQALDVYEGGHRRATFIVKWPELKGKQGAVSDEAGESGRPGGDSFAKIIGHRLGKKDAIDSYDLLSVLKGELVRQEPLRVATVHEHLARKTRFKLYGKEATSGMYVTWTRREHAKPIESPAYLAHFGRSRHTPERP